MRLEARDLTVSYDGVRVLWGASLTVEPGEMVALLGSNGSGKSTLMNSLSRLVPLESGSILLDGRPIEAVPPHESLSLGMAHVLERHRLFPQMTVLENLVLGAGPGAERVRVREGLEEAFALFPRLRERRSQASGSLSGGEQQMCAIARGLMSKPRLLLVDEPFIGLSPQMRSDVEAALLAINRAGVGVLMIEQNVKEALRMTSRAYVLRAGRVVLSASSASLAAGEDVQRVFMGQDIADGPDSGSHHQLGEATSIHDEEGISAR